MLYTAIFLSIFIAGWLVCAFVPWLVLSVATRGNAGMAYLPLCLFAGAVAGFAVPILGLDDGTGLVLSFVAAAIVPTLLLGISRFTRPALLEQRRAARHAKESSQTR